MDPVSESLFEVDTSLQELAHAQGLSIEEVLDRLLLSLWDALFLSQSIQWTEDNVANLPSDEANELARWFPRGQAVGAKPIFDGICAMCGALCDGDPIVTADSAPDVDAQPPFLLRFIPSVLAEEAPRIFDHDRATNRLFHRQGVAPLG